MEIKHFPFELKSLDLEAGTGEGYAAVKGNIDLDGDLIEDGAFAKTIAERPKVPVLAHHDVKHAIGLGALYEDDHGLQVKWKFSDVPDAAVAKQLAADGVLTGLSIGYRAIQKKFKNGVRHLQEVAVSEFSLVVFPANDLARVASVKEALAALTDGSADDDKRIERLIKSLQALRTDGEPRDGALDEQVGAAITEQALKGACFGFLTNDLKGVTV